jgi:hypothetical protein
MTEYIFDMSHEQDKFAPAFIAFQTEVRDPQKRSVNPHFKSKFASLEDSIEAIRPIANKHGLSISQWRVGKGLTTLIQHISGQYVRGTAEMIIEKLTPQALGSAVTYERRYSLLGATGTSGDVDDDGEHAMMRDEPRSKITAVLLPPRSEVTAAPLPKDGQVEMFASMIGKATDLAELQEVWHEVNNAHLTPPKVTILETLKDTAKKRLR